MTTSSKEYLTVREVAVRYGVTTKYVYDLLATDRFPGATKGIKGKQGRKWLIPLDSVEAWDRGRFKD